jgi:hypothetical protein
MNRRKNYFSQLLNVSDVRQIEIHTAEPLVPEPSPFEVEIAIAKLKKYKLPGSNQIPAELIQGGGEIRYYGLRSINSLILFGVRKNCRINGRSLLLYQFARRVIKLSVAIIEGYRCYQLHTKFYPISFSQG